jgi:uncharacterized Zn ribbon protein
MVYPECAHEWNADEVAEEEVETGLVVKDLSSSVPFRRL